MNSACHLPLPLTSPATYPVRPSDSSTPRGVLHRRLKQVARRKRYLAEKVPDTFSTPFPSPFPPWRKRYPTPFPPRRSPGMTVRNARIARFEPAPPEGNQGTVSVPWFPVSFLKPGAFLVQGVTTFPTVRALHRLGALPPEAFAKGFDGLLRWLGKSH